MWIGGNQNVTPKLIINGKLSKSDRCWYNFIWYFKPRIALHYIINTTMYKCRRVAPVRATNFRFNRSLHDPT